MEVKQLIAEIKKIEKITNDEWMNSLENRKLKELEFHDKDRDEGKVEQMDQDTYEKFYGNKKYYSTTQDSHDYIDNWIKTNVKDKVFLDYACGNGGYAIKAAQMGAKLSIGLDISSVSIENAKKAAKEAGVADNTIFFQADAENTKLPNDSIDFIMCSGMLHHLDLSYAFYELRRILKQGGKVLAGEALDYNPAIKLYRMLTPQMRTEWEKAHILSLKDIRFAKRFFEIGEVRYWHVTSFLGVKLTFLKSFFNLLDKALTKIPGIRLMAWIFTFELVKEKRD